MAQCEETTTRFPTVVTLSGLRKYRPQLVELVNGQDNYPKPSKIVSLTASARRPRTLISPTGGQNDSSSLLRQAKLVR
jgi:hypothetical protein